MTFKLDVHYLNAEGQPAKTVLGVGDDLDRARRQMTAIRKEGLVVDRLQSSVGTAGDAIFGAEQDVLETPRLQMIPAHRITQLTLEELSSVSAAQQVQTEYSQQLERAAVRRRGK